jgi:hypothetical protein
MRQSTSLNEAEIQAFTDQASFTKPQTQKGKGTICRRDVGHREGYYGHYYNHWHFYDFDMTTH